ncbi:trimethyllysine dioxygenase [Aestuariispira insulae]|uniref:trimethyllysine dioxygenase n=1 Tax=Aestuariispira insulae TaxID=1461337 RepID=A0A3D9H4R1_9PROT|nr:trimethyllysine dioxygenase [Aestuariispira insulae]RED44161.1 trimethyllysine dioxygenase [Aestuariispira insulae]
MAPMIKSLSAAGRFLEVSWEGMDQPVLYPALWLRDHCHAPHSMNQETNQRSVDTFAIPTDIELETVSLDHDKVTVHWRAEDPASEYPVSFLWKMSDRKTQAETHEKAHWAAADLKGALPEEDWAAVMAEDNNGLKSWMEKIDLHGFALVKGVPATPEATQDVLRRIGYIRETIFGGFWDFTANLAFADTAYSNVEIGPHTDGTYSIDSPGYQAFHCLEFDGTGGESIFVDGFKVAEDLRQSDPEAFETLTQVMVPAQYRGDGAHLMAEHPVIGLDRQGNLKKITYNNYDRAPFRLENDLQDRFYRAIGLFHEMINDRAYQLRFGLRPGTVVLFDNWRVLHAREAYQGHRRLCGAYHNKEDFLSTLRLLRE